ncbi:MAG: sialidase family protein [Thermoanaerobaculales bacterium]|jgi:hypothetical protein|nr:sialidase family protein [Thermoanaerobaculales bacterium]
MRIPRIAGCFLLAALAGCASSGPSTDPVPDPLDCRVSGAIGDVAALRRDSGELVIAGGGLHLLRSDDLGASWRRERLPVRCRWPGIAEVGGRLVVSCSEPQAPGRLLVIAEREDGSWSPPVEVDAGAELIIDTGLQAVGGDEVLLFATHIDSRDDLNDAVYSIRRYRSTDAAASWSGAADVVVGRRGEHLEDTRSVHLGGAELLMVYELEPEEAGPSRLIQLRSVDGGESWSRPEVVWEGSDVEPGGYVLFNDGELWLVASSDAAAGGGSYDRAVIQTRRSEDGGASWSEPEVLVGRENQISFGGVALPGGEVLLPSLRFYTDRSRRQLSVVVVDRRGDRPPRCAAVPDPQKRR